MAIRCAFCMKTFCRRCSLRHFTPDHAISFATTFTIEKREAFVLFASDDAGPAARVKKRPLVLSLRKEPVERALLRMNKGCRIRKRQKVV